MQYALCRFLKTKTKYEIQDVGKLYDAAIQLVQVTASTLPISAKWMQVASQILRTYRSDLRGVKTVDMELYWQLFSDALNSHSLSLQNGMTVSHRPIIAELCKLVRSLFARRCI